MEEEGKKGKKVSAHRRVLPPGRGVGWGVPRGGRAAERAGTVVRWACGSRRKCRAFPVGGSLLLLAPGLLQTACQGARLPRATGWGHKGSGPSEGPEGGLGWNLGHWAVP